MNAPPHVPRAHSSGRVRLLLGVVFAVILAAATAALPGTAKAATHICSNQTGTNGGITTRCGATARDQPASR